MKENCWEAKNCGRELNGAKSSELGVCSAASDSRLSGIHDGVNAGRACWVVAGTFCGGKAQGTFTQKEENCMKCEFYKTVRKEEGSYFKLSGGLLARLH